MAIPGIISLLCIGLSLLCMGFARNVIDVSGKDVGDVHFEQLDGHSLSGRPAYVSSDGKMFMYHIMMEPIQDGIGRWVISDTLWETGSASQFVDSWAVSPCLIGASVDYNTLKGWLTYVDNVWVSDPSFTMACFADPDDVLYLDIPHDVSLTGFFVKMEPDPDAEEVSNTYMKVKRAEDDPELYIYKLEDKWLLGENIGANNAVGFCKDGNADRADEITTLEWLFHCLRVTSTLICWIVYVAIEVSRASHQHRKRRVDCIT